MQQSKLLQKPKKTSLDDFFKLGWYTLLVCLMSEFMILNQVGNMLYMMYAGVAPNVVGCGSHDFSDLSSLEICKKLENLKSQNDSCIPVLETQFESVNYEWKYYCSETQKVKQSISIQMIGVMLGSVIFGQASDIFGRKWTMFIGAVFCQLFMIISSFTNSLMWFTAWRFFVNIFNGGTFAINLVYVMENIPKKDRIWINNLVDWAPNIIIFSLMAYYSGDWRTLTRVSAVFSIPAILLVLVLGESPRYLIQRGRLTEAKNIIRKMCRIDRRNFDEDGLDQVLASENKTFLEAKSKSKNYTFFHLFYTAKFAKYTVALGFSLIVTSIIFYSFLFNIESLSGSIYWNSVMMAAIRFIANMAVATLERSIKKMGRKSIHFFSLVIVEVALLVILAILLSNTKNRFLFLSNMSAMVIVGIMSQFYIVTAVVSNELFPTCVRNLSYSFTQFCSKIGVIIAPNVFALGLYWDALPYTIMLALAVANQFLFQFNISETKGKPLNDHMPGPEMRIFRNKKALQEMISLDPESAQKLKGDEC